MRLSTFLCALPLMHGCLSEGVSISATISAATCPSGAVPPPTPHTQAGRQAVLWLTGERKGFSAMFEVVPEIFGVKIRKENYFENSSDKLVQEELLHI